MFLWGNSGLGHGLFGVIRGLGGVVFLWGDSGFGGCFIRGCVSLGLGHGFFGVIRGWGMVSLG